MDSLRVLLDRELLISAIVHDLRGALTAAQGWAELEEGDDGPLTRVLVRVATLVEDFAEGVAPPATVELYGQTVRVTSPIDILHLAIDGLQHTAVAPRVEGDVAAFDIAGVPADEAVAGWSLAQVRTWLAEGGPGLAGARLQIAARRVGAARCQFAPSADGAHVVVTVRLPRG
jgi:hypothetical protein